MVEGWVPIAKSFVKCLPKDRSYTKLEAVYSLAVDYNERKLVSIAGYAKLWGWSRKRVRNFLDQLKLKIGYPKDTTCCQKQWGQIQVQKGTEKEQIGNRKVKNREQITFIDFKDLQSLGNRNARKMEQKRNRSGSSTTNNNRINRDNTKIYAQEFSAFWSVYPLKMGRKRAFEAWQKLYKNFNIEELLPIILQAIETQKRHKQEKKARGEFVPEWPHPTTWLNDERWKDEVQLNEEEDLWAHLPK